MNIRYVRHCNGCYEIASYVYKNVKKNQRKRKIRSNANIKAMKISTQKCTIKLELPSDQSKAGNNQLQDQQST